MKKVHLRRNSRDREWLKGTVSGRETVICGRDVDSVVYEDLEGRDKASIEKAIRIKRRCISCFSSWRDEEWRTHRRGMGQ